MRVCVIVNVKIPYFQAYVAYFLCFSEINQTTVPSELPIRGTPPQVELSIQTMTADFFAIDGKRLRLKRPIDRDVSI